MNILICKEYKTNFCYWLIIGGWKNSRTMIKKCPTGVTLIEKYQNNSKCIEGANKNVRYAIYVNAYVYKFA